MKKTASPPPRHGNVRLSLEAKPETKADIIAHGKELSEWSIIGTIRRAIERSRWLFGMEQKGTLLLQRNSDGEIEDLEVPK